MMNVKSMDLKAILGRTVTSFVGKALDEFVEEVKQLICILSANRF